MNHPVPLWLRLIFLFVALQALELVVVFFQPTLVQLRLDPGPRHL